METDGGRFPCLLFPFCQLWCSEESGIFGLSWIARAAQDGEPVHQVIPLPIRLHEKRSMAKFLLDKLIAAFQ